MTPILLIKPQGPKHYKSELMFKLIDIMKVFSLIIFRTIPNSLVGPMMEMEFNFPKLLKFRTQCYLLTSDIRISSRFSDK